VLCRQELLVPTFQPSKPDERDALHQKNRQTTGHPDVRNSQGSSRRKPQSARGIQSGGEEVKAVVGQMGQSKQKLVQIPQRSNGSHEERREQELEPRNSSER